MLDDGIPLNFPFRDHDPSPMAFKSAARPGKERVTRVAFAQRESNKQNAWLVDRLDGVVHRSNPLHR